MSFSFTPEQLAQFQSEGWVAVDDFWSATEIDGMRADLDRLKAAGMLNNVATAGDGATESKERVNLQLCPMAPHTTFYRAMPFAPKVLEAVQQLIGDPFLLHLDQVFLKPGRQGMGTNWHQDNAYFKISDPMKGVALWTAVHDATEANGTMRIIPKSFLEEYEHTRDPDSNHHIRCYPPEERARLVELPAGGALFFAYGVAHCTGANNTDTERAGVALHFLRTDYAQPELIEDSREYRPYLTGPQASGGLNEYGTVVSGTWDAEIESALRQARERAAANV